MCGRYALTTPPELIAELLNLRWLRYDAKPRYNVAPTQTVPVVRVAEDGERELVGMHWGLIPFWAKERAIGNRLINARSESVDEKPSFRHAFKKRRCVIPASGFFEWKKLDAKSKQPYYITRVDEQPMLFAGLWESWNDTDTGAPLESCTILTTEANEALRELHDRMPVVLDVKGCERWLGAGVVDDAKSSSALKALLKPAPGKWFAMRPVSTRVNAPKNDDASVLAPGNGGSRSDAKTHASGKSKSQAGGGGKKTSSRKRSSSGGDASGLFD